VKAGGQQRGTGSQVGHLVHDLQLGVEGLQFIHLLAFFKGFELPRPVGRVSGTVMQIFRWITSDHGLPLRKRWELRSGSFSLN
jgi:hypothetical protein